MEDDHRRRELADGRRILSQNDSAVAFVPYFARYAYETFVVPRRPHAAWPTSRRPELGDLAGVLREVLIRFDNLWTMSFPYVMALHQAPTDGRPHEGFHFHIEFHPPLAQAQPAEIPGRAGDRRRQLPQRHLPEEKAAELQAVPAGPLQARPGRPRPMSESGVPGPDRTRPSLHGRLDSDVEEFLARIKQASDVPVLADGSLLFQPGARSSVAPRSGPAGRDGRDRRLFRLARPPMADPRGDAGGRAGRLDPGVEAGEPGAGGHEPRILARDRCTTEAQLLDGGYDAGQASVPRTPDRTGRPTSWACWSCWPASGPAARLRRTDPGRLARPRGQGRELLGRARGGHDAGRDRPGGLDARQAPSSPGSARWSRTTWSGPRAGSWTR